MVASRFILLPNSIHWILLYIYIQLSTVLPIRIFYSIKNSQMKEMRKN